MNIETQIGIEDFSNINMGKILSIISLLLGHREVKSFKVVVNSTHWADPKAQGEIENTIRDYINKCTPHLKVDFQWDLRPKLHPYDDPSVNSHEFMLAVTDPPAPRK